MKQTSLSTNEQERPSAPSRLWQILRWLPLITMLLTFVILLVLFLMGGTLKIDAWFLSQLLPPAIGLIFIVVIVCYVLIKRRFSKLLMITLLVALLSMFPATLLVNPVAYPASITSMTPSASIRLPANTALKVLWGGDTIETNYHVITPDQRWAYDLAVAPYLTGRAKLEDYGCYGIPVVAPVNGLVTHAHDGEPDMTPGVLSNNFQAPLGNHAVIQLETGTYLVIAHLKQGSVVIKTGDRVEEGQVIGQCGNSGNTSEPHIHIHHQRQNPVVYPGDLSEGLPLYFRDHNGAPMPIGGIKMENNKPIATGEIVQHIGQ